MSFFRANIDAMEGYQPGEQPQGGKFVKLNTNENPYPPSPRVLEAIQRELTDGLRRYPDPVAQEVREKAAAAYGLTADHVIVGNGSDDLLTMICRAFVGEGELIVQPSPTYSLYKTLAQIQGARIESVPYQTLTSLPEGLVKAGAKVTFVANPNSPTGTVVSVEELDDLAGRIEGVLVIDEAYVDFADRNAMELAGRRENVLVLRSFSKSFSLAALRIGLGAGHPTLIDGLMKVKDSYNVNRLSQIAAAAALDDLEYMLERARRVRETRERLTQSLYGLGMNVYASQANFIWAQCTDPPARLIYEELKRRRVLVRYFDHPGLDDCLRITVGTPQEVQVLLDETQSIMKEDAGKG